MKVVYPICCGVDVHKRFLVATIIKTDGITPKYIKKRFSTFNNAILQFKQWLIENDCYDVCMESTGKYWVPIYNLLEDKIRVTVASPKWVAAVKGNKDDAKDSKWIGDLFRLGVVRASHIPEKPVRIGYPISIFLPFLTNMAVFGWLKFTMGYLVPCRMF